MKRNRFSRFHRIIIIFLYFFLPFFIYLLRYIVLFKNLKKRNRIYVFNGKKYLANYADSSFKKAKLQCICLGTLIDIK